MDRVKRLLKLFVLNYLPAVCLAATTLFVFYLVMSFLYCICCIRFSRNSFLSRRSLISSSTTSSASGILSLMNPEPLSF